MSNGRDRVTAVNRRAVLGGIAVAGAAVAYPALAKAANANGLRWVATTRTSPWQSRTDIVRRAAMPGEFGDVILIPQIAYQTIDGIGACFNEMGWEALSMLAPSDRECVLAELFGPDGAGFTLCRMPVGANDFSRNWYSYDETPGDFALANFSVANDDATLIPFIKAAQYHRPDLRLWASPWSPPSWMKRNGHYAMARSRPGWPDNGLPAGAEGREGSDWFIQEPRYFDAYARYFGKFIDAYRRRGIRIGMVMPQNEFNSTQPFPSCCWTPEGLARFLPYLGKEMSARDVAIFFGTLERGDEKLFETVYTDPAAGRFIKGVGAQWAGKGAVPFIHRAHADLPIYQSEQECGNGLNDWRYCRYTWSLMKQYLRNGASGYQYWNIALETGGISRWGWRQNSLLTVDRATKRPTWNHEYWLMKHLSHFVRPGTRRIEAASWTGYDDVLAFEDGKGNLAVVANNPLGDPMPIKLMIGTEIFELTLPADSFNSLTIPV